MTGLNDRAKASLIKAAIAITAAILLVGALLWLKSMKKPEASAPSEEELLEERYQRNTDPIYQKAYELDKKHIEKAQAEVAKAKKALDDAVRVEAPSEEIDRLKVELEKAAEGEKLARERYMATFRAYNWVEHNRELLEENEKHRLAQRVARANLEAAQKALEQAKASGAAAEDIAALEKAIEEAEVAFEATLPRTAPVEKNQQNLNENN